MNAAVLALTLKDIHTETETWEAGLYSLSKQITYTDNATGIERATCYVVVSGRYIGRMDGPLMRVVQLMDAALSAATNTENPTANGILNETAVLPSDKTGTVLSWKSLSTVVGVDHAAALNAMGFRIIE